MKPNRINNPLTVIGIFASFTEIGGAAVLPFLKSDDALMFYVYFLAAFPFTLLILFFATLNWNSKAFYSQSDFSDELNYLKALFGKDYMTKS